MLLRLTAPRQFHPAYSLLGRSVRRYAADERQAEAIYLVVAVLAATVLMLAGQWAWLAVVEANAALHAPFFAAQAGATVAFAGAALWGWKPAVTVTAEDGILHLRQGGAARTVPVAEVDAVERVPALVYHRHWRRYAAVEAFVGRVPPELLLLRAGDGRVVVGLPEPGLSRLEAHLHASTRRAAPAHQAA